MSIPSFEDIFRTELPSRDKFLSRLFGIFNEEVVRHWCRCPQAPYRDLGRPTVYQPDAIRGCTLDFTLSSRTTDVAYVSEMKCELEFEDHRYLRLMGPGQVEHHQNRAFQSFLAAAKEPGLVRVTVGGRPVTAQGAVLVWGAVTEKARTTVMDAYGFSDVLSVESMLGDLSLWQPPEWVTFVAALERWSSDLFSYLKGTVDKS